MKIIYYSQTFFADCDFPLIRELQRMGHDVRYYLPITSFNKRSTLLDIKKLYPHTGIYPASIYPEFEEYKDEIDLSKVYIVNQKYKQKYHPLNLLLYLRLALHFCKQKADVIQLTGAPSLSMKAIYLLARKKLVLTVHDPFSHSSRGNKRTELDRREAFRKIPKLILLNSKQVEDFKAFYRISDSNVFISKLGMYDSITRVNPIESKEQKPFILFFGLISAYKGVEYLMDAMIEVHKQHPEVNLVVAGGGKIYFDMKPYEGLDYIHVTNHYIPTAELAGLLQDCLFSVCPYKDATQSGVVQTAFSMNVPMIVTNVGALPESVHNVETGLVIPPCDVSALTQAINKLLDAPELLATMRQNIQTKWKKEMSWKSIAETYIKCYETKI